MARILIVDDVPICREPIAASLRLSGYETICASNGQEALWVVAAQRPDLILLDMAMPVMDGLSTLKQLRADPATASIPVIVLTAMTEQKSRESLAALRPDDCLLKSNFSLQELLTRIKNVLCPAA